MMAIAIGLMVGDKSIEQGARNRLNQRAETTYAEHVAGSGGELALWVRSRIAWVGNRFRRLPANCSGQ